MAWPTSSLFVAANVLTAAQLNAVRADLAATNGFVRKTADESVTSNIVLQNDDHLFYTISNTGTYVIDLYLQVTSAANAAGDLALAFTFPTGTMTTFVVGPDITLASGHVSSAVEIRSDSLASGTAFANLGASTSGTLTWVHAVFVATATGTLQLQWAQQSSSASATTVKSGSHMTVRQVA